MKKAFFIVSTLVSLISLPVLGLFINTSRFYAPGKSLTHLLFSLVIPVLITIVPLISLVIGFLKSKKTQLSKAYSLTFIIVNVILG